MKNTYTFFAFDLGATSGRSILATLSDGKLELKELTRFPNKVLQINDKFYWNIYSLFEELKRGLCAVQQQGINPDAIGIDTWGVDFVYVAEDGTFLGLPRSYRDPYTNDIPAEYFSKISRKDVYKTTGIQIMNFNSLFQLYASKKESSSSLEYAESILFIPDALSYLLTGRKVCEYSIASTSQILNPRTKKFESRLLEPIEISEAVFGDIVMQGTIVGHLTDSLQKECGLGEIPVIAVAGHDTGSAVIAAPAENENFAYLSSGTWSLMGIEVADPIITEDSYKLNFTNEGGVDGTTRFLKNIAGMWLLEQCRKEWSSRNENFTHAELIDMSDSVNNFKYLVDPDDPSFANPQSMTQAISDYCIKTNQQAPVSHAEYVRCIFDSLVLKYKYVFDSLQQLAPFRIDKLHIIGGGSQNKYLNQATANAIGIPVIAGPTEATAIGNVMMQAKGLGVVCSLKEIRDIVRSSSNPDIYEPSEPEKWNNAYDKFLSITEIESTELNYN